MKFELFVFIAPILLLSACASAVKSFDEAGRPTVRVDCAGLTATMNDCYAKVLKECPNGYFKVQEGDTEPSQAINGNSNAVNNIALLKVPHSLTVRCK